MDWLTTILIFVCLAVGTSSDTVREREVGRSKDKTTGIERVSWITMDEDKAVDFPAYQFSCSISTDKMKYAPEEAVMLTFKLTNNNNCDMYVLRWHTPMEGMRNNYLDVTVGGETVPYRGMMAKRGPPSADSYTLIVAGETAVFTVDITKGYSTKTCGKYSVQLNTNLMDVVTRKVDVEFAPSGFDDFTTVAISSDSVEFDVVC